ncbi:unnamed protein product [Penicillium salamii]|uniref:Uncharacterized protein n=1 Tax=Penicillium salamii TaxID=1612424 RepID=A0A9W4IE88_9EURO|nr:unnamed protein product [Penicillium salamii]
MSQSSCQFIYFRVKPSVRPEDPSSEEGQALLNVFRTAKHQSGHQSSAWGRTSEDPDLIVWVMANQTDWSDARSSTDQGLQDPFLAEDNSQLPTSIYVTLSPPITATETLTQNPVTELCTLPYANLISFRTAQMESMPQVTGPVSWAMGQLDRPCKLNHALSPSGKATVHFLAVG